MYVPIYTWPILKLLKTLEESKNILLTTRKLKKGPISVIWLKPAGSSTVSNYPKPSFHQHSIRSYMCQVRSNHAEIISKEINFYYQQVKEKGEVAHSAFKMPGKIPENRRQLADLAGELSNFFEA